jgi:hypothetical protein
MGEACSRDKPRDRITRRPVLKSPRARN